MVSKNSQVHTGSIHSFYHLPAPDGLAFIRKTISAEFGKEIAEEVSILYGGSVKPANAKEIFAKEDVDGGLIGGASLKAEDFLAIVHSF